MVAIVTRIDWKTHQEAYTSKLYEGVDDPVRHVENEERDWEQVACQPMGKRRREEGKVRIF